VYWISVLDPHPQAERVDRAGWNGRLVYRYGGGCGQSFGQGETLGTSTLSDPLLSTGYAVATATFNTFQVQCNDVLSAETTMMVKGAERAANSINEVARGAQSVGPELELTMREVRGAARSIRRFVDALERDPDMLLKGRATVAR
jgi:hypothetical protein